MSSLIVKVRRVREIKEHPNGDRIEIARVAGWDCIVPINRYKSGDIVIFVPPDSILPPDFIERFDIGYLKSKTGRVGVVKLRGVHSYGIVVDNLDGFKRGADVASYYNITKWEPPTLSWQQVAKRRGHQDFKRYTKIENLRNFPDVFEEGEEVVITEKIHGTNFRAGYVKPVRSKLVSLLFGWALPKYDFVFGSHNVELGWGEKTYYGRNLYGRIARMLGLKNKIPGGYVVYGEIFGPGIQDLVYGLRTVGTVFYDITYKGRYIDHDETQGLLRTWGLQSVPVLYRGLYSDSIVEHFISEDSVSTLDKGTIREGVVIKPLVERLTPQGGRVILKAINPRYLTRKQGTEHK